MVLNATSEMINDAILAFSLGDEIEAKNLLNNVLSTEPANLEALRAISEVSLAIDHVDEAESFCRQALQADPNDLASLVSLARILVKKGDKEGAEEATAKARILGWKEELKDDQSDSL
jgi:predicted Zn-dependent protease